MGAEGASPTQRKRDPERRRREIVQAATEMLLEGSILSHRAVAQRAGVPLGATTYYFSSLHDLREAAVCQLAEEVTVELTDLAEQVAAADGDPRVLARLLHDYLTDTAQVRADAALYSAASQHEDLRHIALRWVDGFVELASGWTDPATARAIRSAVAGATTTRSACWPKRTWGTSETSSNTPVCTGLPDSASKVAAPTNLSADSVGTTRTECPASLS